MLYKIKKAFTFDDVLIIPEYSKVLPNTVNLSTYLTNKISLNIPILSAAMDSVTESNLAIALAKEGGIGFIHKNMSIYEQVKQINNVKNYHNGVIINPKCVHPNDTIHEVKKLIKLYGFSNFPVVTKKNKLLGMINNKNVMYSNNNNQIVSKIMIPKKKLITFEVGIDYKLILNIMCKNNIKNVLIIDKNCHLIKMITLEDIKNNINNLHACKDEKGRLRVGAAVGINGENKERIDALVKAEIDVLLIDSSHGHSEFVLNFIKETRYKYPNLQIIGGNVATKDGAIALVKAGVNAIKVGIGPGSICTTRIVTGVGVPQITAISDVVKAIKGSGIPIIADGGIRFSGDIAKSIVAGASCVMLGLLLAGTYESPGKIKLFKGKYFKSYRGMGSLRAMKKGSSERYFQKNNTLKKFVPEGVEGYTKYIGRLKDTIYQYMGGLRSCMGLTGCKTIEDLRTKAKFIQITKSGFKESKIHDIYIDNKYQNF